MIVGVVIDGDGRPVCSEMWPGNTADVTVLVPVIDRLRHRFAIGRVCVVADRGMISTATIAALEERGLEYVLGVRERTDKAVRETVLTDTAPFTPLVVERAQGRTGGETQLFAKEVVVDGRRYVGCRNEAEAEKDRADRQAIVDGLEKQLKKGDKALIGNSAYRRYLRKVRGGDDGAAIRGHVFCSFLALVLRKELQNRCVANDLKPEWADVLRDLDRLQQATVENGGKTWSIRTEATGAVPAIMKAVRIALPPRAQPTGPPPPTNPTPPTPKRRSRPRHGATRA